MANSNNILKKLVMIADIGIIIFMLWIAIIDGIHESEILSFFGVLLLIILNIIFIYRGRYDKDNGWLNLFLKRKVLEERQKINKLEQVGK